MNVSDNRNIREDLKDFLMDIEILDQLELHSSKFNVFQTLGIVNAEIRHSNVMAWLLSPRENHDMGDYILKKLIQTISYQYYDEDHEEKIDPIKIALIDYDDFEVRREWKNIDILLVSKQNKYIVVIENKVWSKESQHQLNKYESIVNEEFKEYKKIFIYLTPYGDSASNNKWVSVSYQLFIDIIEKAFKLKKDMLNERVLLFIEQYLEILRGKIVGDKELEELCREIYFKHKKALDVIFEYKPDIYSDISSTLQDLIQDTPGLILDDSSKTYIRFTTDKLESYYEEKGKGWTSTGRMLLFEFQNKDHKLFLKLIIGPGDTNVREKIYEIASQSDNVLKTISKQASKQYAQIYSKEFLGKNYHDDYEYDFGKIQDQIKEKFKKFMEADLTKIHDCLINES